MFRVMCQCFTSNCQIIYMNVVSSDIKHHILLHHKTVYKLLNIVDCDTPYPCFPLCFRVVIEHLLCKCISVSQLQCTKPYNAEPFGVYVFDPRGKFMHILHTLQVEIIATLY
jgi:hypothetical protein